MIKCLIIEDEKAAQDVLLNYLEQTPFLQCIGIFESGLDITPAVLEKADLLFLDIQLPGLNGLTYLKSLTPVPKVIITTAFANYAVEAFDTEVVDYLLKPFSFERFFKAVQKVRAQIQLEGKAAKKDVFLYADKTLFKVKIEDILYLKAEVDYVKVISKEKSILILDSLKNWEEKLVSTHFIRIHRSYLINTQQIEKVVGNQVYIQGQALPIGKVYREAFFRGIGYGK